jgi:hypothetical protein
VRWGLPASEHKVWHIDFLLDEESECSRFSNQAGVHNVHMCSDQEVRIVDEVYEERWDIKHIPVLILVLVSRKIRR